MMPRVKPTHVDSSAKSHTTWDDVAGVEEVRAELMEVVDFLREPKRFERLGASVPKGLLLYGPPGTGKTLLAKAVAHESGANFYSASASSFVEMFAGLGAARIRKLFEEARKNAPAIVFIDELDAVGAQRTGHGFNREQDQTLNQLLVELDGFEGAQQVVVMGASNRIQDLDQALLRPGRFDRQMLVPPPDLDGREAILGVHTRGKPLASNVDLRHVAKQTSGLTGAELANICNEAAIFAGRRDDQFVTQMDFDAALERVVAGLQQKKVLTEKERRILSYHEGGHALMAHLMGSAMELQKVTIVSRGDALGYAFYLPEEDRYLHTKEELIDRMVVALAGPRSRGGRLRPRHDRCRERSREGDRDRALDGLRVGHGRRRLVPHDARRQLRPLGRDEAAARQRAGPLHRHRLRGRRPPAEEAPGDRSTRSRRCSSRRRRWAATRSSSCSPTSSPSRGPPTWSGCRGSSRRRLPTCPSDRPG